MVEANAHGILKNANEDEHGARHVKFDEEELTAYDATRGQCQTIDDPKTPFHEENSDDEMEAEAELEAEPLDPELASHLEEAKNN